MTEGQEDLERVRKYLERLKEVCWPSKDGISEQVNGMPGTA